MTAPPADVLDAFGAEQPPALLAGGQGVTWRSGTGAWNGIIDWPPYFRPTGWALAVVAVDAVCWQGAEPALLESWSDVPAWEQMLLRALVYRVATSGRVDPGYVPVREELVLDLMGAA